MEAMKLGIVDLGPLGARLARRALARGHSVVGFDKSGLPRPLFGCAVEAAPTLEALAAALDAPRVVLLATPAGVPTDEAFLGARRYLSDGDVVLDASASHWRDSVRRYRSLRARGLRLLDLGLASADPEGAWSVMAGGDLDAYAAVSSLLEALAEPGQAAYVGPPGAGHFARAACQALEETVRQALAEGFALLAGDDYRFDAQALARLWQAGSGLSGAALERLERGLRGDVEPAQPDKAQAWVLEHALEKSLAVPLMALARFEALRVRAAGAVSAPLASSGKPAPARG